MSTDRVVIVKHSLFLKASNDAILQSDPVRDRHTEYQHQAKIEQPIFYIDAPSWNSTVH